MKKNIVLLLILNIYFGYTQCVDPTITDFECSAPSHPLVGAITTISNPFSTGINTSANVGEFIDDGTAPFDNLSINYGIPIDLSINSILHIKVYTQLATPKPLVAKLEGGTTALEVTATINVSNVWQEYTFDFSSVVSEGNTTLVLFFNAFQSDGALGDTYYIDDLFFAPAVTTCSEPIITDFECDNPSHPITGALTKIANPFSTGINTSANVGEFIDDGTDPFDNLSVNYGSAIDLSVNSILHVKIYTELVTPKPIVAKLEGGTTTLEIPATIDVSDGWKEYTFDFSSVASEGNTTLVLFFNAFQTDGAVGDVYYIDDLFFAAPITTCSDPTLTDFECNNPSQPITGALTRIANPVSGGINTSAFVGEYIDNPLESFDNIAINYSMPIDLSVNNKLKLKIYAPTTVPLLIKLENGTSPAVELGNCCANGNNIDVANQWKEYVFDFSSQASENHQRVVLFINAGNTGIDPQTFYIDDIRWDSFVDDSISSAGDGDWNLGSTWAGGIVPTSNDNALIDHALTVTSDEQIKALTITSEGIVSINAGKSLSISENLVTRDNLILNSISNSFSSLIVEGNTLGEIEYRRVVEQQGVNDLISSPVNVNFGDFSSNIANSNLFENPSTTTQKLFGPFDNAVSNSYLIYDEISNATTSLVAGKGYRAATTDGGALAFKETPHSNITNIEIDLTVGSGTFGLWNLIGNPYPSYLDFDLFFTENSDQLDNGVYQAIYGYNGSTSDKWTVWNALNTSDKITPGQGFFVRTKVGGGTVIFDPVMRVIGSTDDFIEGRSSESNSNSSQMNANVLSQISLSTVSNTYFTKIFFVENQTRGLDPGYDAGAYGGSAQGVFTNLVEDNNGVDLAIQALPYNDYNDIIVPLGVRVPGGVAFNIGISEVSTLPSNINVYLIDNVRNSQTLLNNSNYVLTPSQALNGVGRFYLQFASQTLSENDISLNNLVIYKSQLSNEIVIKGQLDSETIFNLYNVQGGLIVSNSLDTSSDSNVIDVSEVSSGIYIAELKSNNKRIVQKIILD